MSEQRNFDLMVLPASAMVKQQPRQKQHGYAAIPGTGPTGETCRSCEHMVRKQISKTYLKCDLMSAHWTGGAGSDVRARSPACRRWEPQARENVA